MEPTVHLALGARDGDRRGQMAYGLAGLARLGARLVAVSSLWETEPVDLPGDLPVFNAAALLEIDMAPRRLLRLCQSLEEGAGRRRGAPEWRSLDLDILLMGSTLLTEPGFELPHPRFHLRRFNLAPLAEIAPHAVHPRLGLSIASLLRDCADESWARILEKDWTGAAIERDRGVR